MHYIDHHQLPITVNGLSLNNDETTFTNSCLEIANTEQVPLPLPVQAVLSASSIAHSRDFEIDYPLGGGQEPINLFNTSIVGSGIGKGRVFKHAIQPIYDFHDEHLKTFELQKQEYECDLMLWEDELKEIRKQPPSDEKKAAVQLHRYSKPKPPVKWLLALQDTTPLGIAEQAQELPSLGVITSEGKQFFNPKNQQEMEKSASNWSNESITYTRKAHHIDIQDTPFTYLVFIQPGAFHKFMDKKGDEFRDSGFAARTNFFYLGDQYIPKYASNMEKTSLSYIPIYQQVIREALEKKRDKFLNKDYSKTLLRLSPAALNRWTAVHNEIQAGMDITNPRARFHGALDHAARLMQNITRFAANIHLVNDRPTNEICLEDLNQAILIGAFFSDQFRALFVKPPLFIQDAMLLDNWLQQYRGQCHKSFIRKNFVRQNGPNALRKDGRMDQALQTLQQHQSIRLFSEDNTTWINLMPAIQQLDVLPEEFRKQPRAAISTGV